METAQNIHEIVYTDTDRCIGCNKCIRNCPIVGANAAYVLDGENKVKVNQDLCIRCGACLDSCTHEARLYRDDTDSFFQDLLNGEKISIVAAPAARVNFANYKKMIGFLKHSGVDQAYDVSFGADITTWAYLKAIRERNLSSVIAQPCPAIVNYIEKFQPELIANLAPIHSPTLCTAIFMKKYAKIPGKIAFISPCLGKFDEFNDTNTGGVVSYNVTYRKMFEHLEKNNIDLSSYEERDFDDIGCWLGCLYSRPGGLRENVETLVSGAWVRQIEGHHHAYPYLKEYRNRRESGKPLPLLVDILNCANGCNIGTATMKNISIDDADSKLNKIKHEKNREKSGLLKKKSTALFDMLESKLELADFMRQYTDRRVMLKSPSDAELEKIYRSMHKDTEASRRIDCSACGYATCVDMAKAVYNGINDKVNCIDFNRHEIALETERIGEKTKIIDELSSYTANIVSVLDEVSMLNLDVEVEGAFSGEFQKIKKSINQILETLNYTMSELKQAAEQFGAGAEQVSQGSTTLAAATAEQAGAVEKLSSLIGMLTEKTRLNASNANRARDLSSFAKDAAEEGNRSMESMLRSMEEINTASANITKILKTIDDIAFQTNILALNAAVEAARAGKYGKGFAVVADEVRTLAVKCSTAAKESAHYIAESIAKVKSGSDIANETAEMLARIVQNSSEIAGIVETIAATSSEQTSGIESLQLNVQQVEHVVQSNSSTSQESAATSEQLSAQAVSLKESVSKFRLRGR